MPKARPDSISSSPRKKTPARAVQKILAQLQERDAALQRLNRALRTDVIPEIRAA